MLSGEESLSSRRCDDEEGASCSREMSISPPHSLREEGHEVTQLDKDVAAKLQAARKAATKIRWRWTGACLCIGLPTIMMCDILAIPVLISRIHDYKLYWDVMFFPCSVFLAFGEAGPSQPVPSRVPSHAPPLPHNHLLAQGSIACSSACCPPIASCRSSARPS